MGLVPLTREAIVPYLVAVSLLARLYNTELYVYYSSHIRQALCCKKRMECLNFLNWKGLSSLILVQTLAAV